MERDHREIFRNRIVVVVLSFLTLAFFDVVLDGASVVGRYGGLSSLSTSIIWLGSSPLDVVAVPGRNTATAAPSSSSCILLLGGGGR